MAELDDLADALASFEVEAGFPEKRRVLAGKLLAEGVSVADVEALGRHCESTVVDRTKGDRRAQKGAGAAGAATRVLHALLTHPDKRTERLRDLAAIAKARADRLARQSQRPAGEGKPHVPMPLEGEDHEQWEFERQCEIAYGRAVTDGRGIAVAAHELRLPHDFVRQLVDYRIAMAKWRFRPEGDTTPRPQRPEKP